MSDYDPVGLEIAWHRMISVVDEAHATLQRTAFSTLVREANDLSVVLTDSSGKSVVQSTASVPPFVRGIPTAVRHILMKFPTESWKPGDVAIVNDPWMATGHVNDVTIVSPIIDKEGLIAFMGNTIHAADVGGRVMGVGASDMYEEGLRLLPDKLYIAGKRNETLFSIIESNVRLPNEVIGDFEAQVTANEVGARKLRAILRDLGWDCFSSLANSIQKRTGEAMRNAIRNIENGSYEYELRADGVDQPIILKARIHVRDEEITIDYSGSSEQQPYGINVVPNYTFGYTAFTMKCLLCPEVPNNEGGFKSITVKAPFGCILNPIPPSPVGGRNIIGHMLPSVLLGAMAQVLPEKVFAESGSAPSWAMILTGERENGERFSVMSLWAGGVGASHDSDGLSAMCFPSNAACTPLEVLEHAAPIVFEEKQLIPFSGGEGKYRGGLGYRVRFRVTSPKPIQMSLLSEHHKLPAKGLFGGAAGSLARVTVDPPRGVLPKGYTWLQPGDRVTLETPGGGGYGEASKRSKWLVLRDQEDGLI